jgi:hypothetical protein
VKIEAVIWLRDVVDKLIKKHCVETAEVEEVLNNQPKIRFVEKGLRRGEECIWHWGKRMRGATLP